MSLRGLTGLLLAPWWTTLQHYTSLTGLLFLSIVVLENIQRAFMQTTTNLCAQEGQASSFLCIKQGVLRYYNGCSKTDTEEHAGMKSEWDEAGDKVG